MPRSTRTCDCFCDSSKDKKLAEAEEIDAFLADLLGIEQAWSALDDVERLRQTDEAAARRAIDQAVERGGISAQVLTRAASLRAADDADGAHLLLERAVALDAPPAPAQIALARSFRARGDLASARHWLRGAMLRARPDATLLLELATIAPGAAAAIVAAARSFPCREARAAFEAGRSLLQMGERGLARTAFDLAFEAGERSNDFVLAYNALLADPALGANPPPPGPLGMPRWWLVATMAAQVQLARAWNGEEMRARVRARRESPGWIEREQIALFLRCRIERREPFSWIRLGDGEARFLLHAHPALRAALPEREAQAMARQIWHVWFGQDITTLSDASLSALAERLDTAIRNADLLGVTAAERLTSDKLHGGFCAALEQHLADLLGDAPDMHFCDATLNNALNEVDPFFASLLTGLDFVGVISPHPDLAARLQRRLGIGTVAQYDIPGESRLDRPREQQDRGTHFPRVYTELMASLAVPRPGAVFLVAGGLLGKIYCDRIRTLGGIALDIGAVADAWMGHNTRGEGLAGSMRRQLPA